MLARPAMHDGVYTITTAVWRYPGKAGWHFVTVSEKVTDEVRARTAGHAGPFGTVPAQITIGSTSWATSLFADTKRDAYLIPIKAPVRRAEGIAEGDTVTIQVTLGYRGSGALAVK
jgi:uncharacterized protein DUF1905